MCNCLKKENCTINEAKTIENISYCVKKSCKNILRNVMQIMQKTMQRLCKKNII